jgi:hypothetical protein
VIILKTEKKRRDIILRFFLCVLLTYVKMDLGEIGWDGVDWIDLAQDRDQWRALVNMVMNLRVL